MDYRIREIIKTFNMLRDYADSWPQAKLDSEAVSIGLDASKTACTQKEFVFPTPLMKNLLVVMGDVTQSEVNGEWKTEKLRTGAKSRAVTWIDKVVKAALLKYNGEKKEVYDINLPADSMEYYNTDCWMNWNIEKFWDIKPGQAEERAEQFKAYANPKTNFSEDQILHLLKTDEVFQATVVHFLENWPVSKASWDVRKINDPFMSKKTGVSYPFFRNDATKVPKTNITYGEYCINIVKNAARRGISALEKLAQENNVYTGYPRNQRGKGRALEAQSRIVNLIVNMLNANELKAVQESTYGVGLTDEQHVRERLIATCEFSLSNPQYLPFNLDFTGWDRTVGKGWVTLQNALRYLKANGSLAKGIVKIRHACVTRSVLLDGPAGKVLPLYGRTPSGYIDTTLQNTAINALQSDYNARLTQSDYSKRVTYPMRNQNISTLGDDLLVILSRDAVDKFKEGTKKTGYSPHEGYKDAVGPMFLQYRLFKINGKYEVAYPWPRVLRSMLSKEDQKSLGKAGWTFAFYQQLGKLRRHPTALMIATSIAAALDKDHLSLDTPVTELIKMTKQEDEERFSGDIKSKKAKRIRLLSTAERLSNNPMLPGTIEKNGETVLDEGYFAVLQKELKAAYDPEFLPKLGFINPNLARVH